MNARWSTKRLALTAAFLPLILQPASFAAVKVVPAIAYKAGGSVSVYERERCLLDLYLPEGRTGFATLVWFHGGGMEGGERDSRDVVAVARSLAEGGVAVASVGYRLSPKASFPAYIEDAAAAFAWTTKHVAERGGNPDAVFVGGHSAGGYLAYMVALDPRYLNAHGVELSSVAGAIPVSGQTMDHYTVRKERGGGRYPVTAGEAAPIYYCRSNTPPVLVLYADQDMAGRQAENEYLVEMMKGAGNSFVQGLLIRDRDHGSIAGKIKNQDDPARRAILEFMHRGGKPVY